MVHQLAAAGCCRLATCPPPAGKSVPLNHVSKKKKTGEERNYEIP